MRVLPIAVAFALSAASSARAQCALDELHPSDGSAGDQFGYDVALSGDTAAVSSPRHASERGAAYVFERSGGAWSQTQKLMASDGDPDDLFGYVIDLEGDTLALAAPEDEHPHGANGGAAYIFERHGGAWVQVQKLAAIAGQASDEFAFSLALDGDQLLIGAPRSDLNNTNGGAVFVFERVGGSFQETDVLFPALPLPTHQEFGWKVEQQDSRALIATGGSTTDTVYVFEESGGVWSETAVLEPPGPGSYDSWGDQLALDGDTALVASTFTTSLEHRIYVFERGAGGWSFTQEIVPPPPAGVDGFGHDLELAGDVLWIGTPFDDELYFSSGAVFRYVRDAGSFALAGKWVADGTAGSTSMGYAMAIEGRTGLFGAPSLFTMQAGSARVVDLPEPGAFAYCFCPEPGVCANGDEDAGCANSTGLGGRLNACGSSSVALDDQLLVATHLRPDQFALFFMGAGQASNPLGDGIRCTNGGGVGQFRFVVEPADAAGNLQLGPGLVAFTHSNFPPAGRIQPGQTWNFQCWYRDPGGPCGSNFNLSNAVRIAFQP